MGKRTVKHNQGYVYCPRDQQKLTYLIHGLGYSSDECKVLKDFGTKYTKFRPCNCRVDDSTKFRYEMILVIDLLIALLLNLKLSEHVIEADYGPLKGLLSPMVDFGTY